MGLLDSAVGKGLGAIGLRNVNDISVVPPTSFRKDFESLEILEYIDGRPQEKEKVLLVGAFMPRDTLDYGGSQRVTKDYYPGNSEPVLQVMGAQEDDTTIRGRFTTKKLRDPDLAGAAQEYQELVDAMRIRGNVVRIKMGEWIRFGIIGSCKFKLKRLTDIEYEITFVITGFNPPKNNKLVDTDRDLIAPNKDLTTAAAAALAAATNYPSTLPQTTAEFLGNVVSDIATSINQVTNFVEDNITDAENILMTANRALGLIRNARAVLSRSLRRIGSLGLSSGALGGQFSSESSKFAASITNVKFIKSTSQGFGDLRSFLESLRLKYAAIAGTIPFRRHLVNDGDTLQKLAVKYYNNAESWSKIYDHNKLTSTSLTVGSVLEIPRS